METGFKSRTGYVGAGSPFSKGHGNALKYSPHHKNQITKIQFILYINKNASILRELLLLIYRLDA